MADTGYNPVPSVQPTADAQPLQSVPADEESFGAGIGRSMQRTGAIMRRNQEAEFALSLQLAQQENETRALDASTEYTRQSNEITSKYRQLNGQQAVDALPAVEKQLTDLDKEIGKGLKSPSAQRMYKSRAQSILTSGMQVTGLHAATQASAAADASKVGAIGAAKSRFVTNFGLTDTKPDIDEIVSLTADLAFTRGLPKEAADVLIQNNVGEAFKQVMGVFVSQGKFDEAKAVFEETKAATIPGTDLPVFNGEQIVAVNNEIEKAENLQRIDDARQVAAADKARHDASEAAYKKYVDQIIVDPTKLDIKSVGNDPNLSGQHGETLLRLYQEQIKRVAGATDPDENKGPGFWEAFRAVTADKPTITSQQQIYDMTGQGRQLTLIGANALVSLMNSRKTGDAKGDFDTERKTRFFTNMQLKITDGIDTPQTQDAAFKFYMDKTRQIEQGLKDGKKLVDMLDPSAKDFIGSDVETYRLPDDVTVEPPPEPTNAWLAWFGNAFFGDGKAFSTQALDKDIPSGSGGSPAGIGALKAAIAAGHISKDAASQYAIRRGWAKPRAPAAPTGPVVPAAVR